jgi:hypothetical protein
LNITEGYSWGWTFDGYILCYLDCQHFEVTMHMLSFDVQCTC